MSQLGLQTESSPQKLILLGKRLLTRRTRMLGLVQDFLGLFASLDTGEMSRKPSQICIF